MPDKEELSGRDLDAMVAGGVMGLQVLGVVPCEYDFEDGSWDAPYDQTARGTLQPIYLKPNYCGCEFRRAGEVDYSGHSAACVSVVPFFSSSIEVAMKVVEKMREMGWSFACTLYEGHLPYASFCKQTVASSRNAEAQTLTEAICRAALKAISSNA